MQNHEVKMRFFRIKKLDIFIAKQFGLLFVGTFFICQFVLMMQFLWRYVDELIGKGLTIDVLAQFFWYMGLMLMPQAFPLAILLSSLIAFGNLGESSELTAIKAAGISLMQAFRSLIVLVCLIAACSLFFQDVVGPSANQSFYRLLIAMKQKSPELEIPEGIFYDGIPGSNLYVQKKDMKTGKLYGIMIYRMNGSYEDQAIILADSGMLQSTAEKKHLLLTLHSGEWFENMRSQDVVNSASVPYRRETFSMKRIVLDFDGGLNIDDVSDISSDARSKSIPKLYHDLDSIHLYNDSVGHAFYADAKRYSLHMPILLKQDSLRAEQEIKAGKVNIDTVLAKLTTDSRQRVYGRAASDVRMAASDLSIKGDYSKQLNRIDRRHQIEIVKKLTLSLSCIIFFFIGAPLGAIIRKGGLGVPVIISVLVFIIYYIFENSGTKMARDDNWTVWFGTLISTMVLTPLAVFVTYKANRDSTVFNVDAYKSFFMSLFGIKPKRHVSRKEVIINDPDYAADAATLQQISDDITEYAYTHHLLHLPNPVKVFFSAGNDQMIKSMNVVYEEVIEDLSNSKDKRIINELNNYPIIAVNAHTRLFRRKWLNIVSGLILPLGLFLYLRMWRFRLRLYANLKQIKQTNGHIIQRIEEMGQENVAKNESV